MNSHGGAAGCQRVKGFTMVLLDFSVTPLGKGESVSAYVARCLDIVVASGLDYRLHAMGTTLEGDLDQVLSVIRRCFEALQADCNRISCSIKIDYRKGSAGRLQSKVQKVQALVGHPLRTAGATDSN
jgi:uncharacterized protein (TIGR00106 family)